jgi:hypothetical protein
MPEDSINTLVGTFSALTASNLTEQTMEQCICIDTSNNRIGINTLNPSYAIDISNIGTSVKESIRTPRLIISDKIGINTLDPSYAIDISNIGTTDKSYIRTPRLIISDISRLTFPNNIINSSNISSMISGEIYVDASNYLRLR